MKIHSLAALALTGLMLLGCSETQRSITTEPPAHSAAGDMQQTESERLNAFFDEVFERDLQRSPMFDTYLGGRQNYGRLDDMSEQQQDEDIALARADLQRLRSDFDVDDLDRDARLSYRLFELKLEETIEEDRWRHHGYPVNQMFGWQSNLPAFMITAHAVDNADEAEAYISRLREFDRFLGQITDGLELRAEKGVLPPKFVFPIVITNARAIITGAPFDDGPDSTLLADFRHKIAGLDLAADERSRLLSAASATLRDSVKPGFDRLIASLEALEKQATDDAGVWKLPDGDAYYAFRLKKMTTTDMTAAEIHDFGLSEVARIQGEMAGIMKRVGFDGTLQDFFTHLHNTDRFYYPQTDQGKESYIADANRYIGAMKARLHEAFAVLPEADVEVRPVEPFREAGAPAAFYQQPALDGSRPGYFYVNTHDMRAMPKYQLEALVYHEAVPGHHMQIAIAQELQGVPMFRKLVDFTAYVEGWGLYAERLGKDMGFYDDPYADFGRLALEIWRAARLVVDTGLHDKHWTREQAIDYMNRNTPNPPADNVREVERYIVMPGQATAYKIGMAKILELREAARDQMGSAFDLRTFHDVVLKDGAVPLNILEEKVEKWAAEGTAAP